MRMPIASLAIAAAIGTATAAAPGQTTRRPGEATRADVWIQNGRSEPVPVTVQSVEADRPIRVLIANGDPSLRPPTAPVPVRTARAEWEYARFTLKSTPDGIAELNALGQQGWEATGVSSPSPAGDGSILLLKRAR